MCCLCVGASYLLFVGCAPLIVACCVSLNFVDKDVGVCCFVVVRCLLFVRYLLSVVCSVQCDGCC